MSPFVALLDANVLYSAQTRDLFLQLARDSIYQAKWTIAIQEEWRNALLRNATHLKHARIERLLEIMHESFPNALVFGYEKLIESLSLPDPDDRHVLAAAKFGQCDFLVTHNIRHFPTEYAASLGIRVVSPDEFLIPLLLSYPEEFCVSVRKVLARLRNPAYTPEEYLSRLARAGLLQTSSELRQHVHLLATPPA